VEKIQKAEFPRSVVVTLAEVAIVVAPIGAMVFLMFLSGNLRKLRPRIGRRVALFVVPPPDQEGAEVMGAVKRIVEKFGKLSISEVERECNRVREEYLSKWRSESSELVEGSDVRRSTAISEAEPPFELWRPTSVLLEVLDSRYDSVGGQRAPQVTMANRDTRAAAMFILMRWIRKEGDKVYVIDPKNGNRLMTLSDSIVSELLHVSGDLEPEKHDGLVRQTWIGVTAIRPILGAE
jgi:hypothetical protein